MRRHKTGRRGMTTKTAAAMTMMTMMILLLMLKTINNDDFYDDEFRQHQLEMSEVNWLCQESCTQPSPADWQRGVCFNIPLTTM